MSDSLHRANQLLDQILAYRASPDRCVEELFSNYLCMSHEDLESFFLAVCARWLTDRQREKYLYPLERLEHEHHME